MLPYIQRAALGIGAVSLGAGAYGFITLEGERDAEGVNHHPMQTRFSVPGLITAPAGLMVTLGLLIASSKMPPGARQALESLQALRGELEGMDLAAGSASQMRDDTLRMVTTNQRRMQWGQVRGFGNHPDYADLGRIDSNAAVLRRLALQSDATSAVVAPGSSDVAW